MGTQITILGDIHISSRGDATEAFLTVVDRLAERQPDLVVLAGDMTSGNREDGHGPGRVASWWRGLHDAIEPLRSAGIPVLPVAGNHDYYTSAHREAYAAAWATLRSDLPQLTLTGAPPTHYAVDLGDLHLVLLHVVDQTIEAPVEAWLRADLAATSQPLRLAVGHVPLRSAMGRTNEGFERRLGRALVEGGVSAYFAGHEHLVWDGDLDIDGRPLRQVIVGTPGASYHFPLRPPLVHAHCQGRTCHTPRGQRFTVGRDKALQRQQTTFVTVDIDGADFSVTVHAIDGDGAVMPFDEAERTRWLQAALNRLLDATLELTGKTDDATRAAVTALQEREAGLSVDGISGPRTRERIRALLA